MPTSLLFVLAPLFLLSGIYGASSARRSTTGTPYSNDEWHRLFPSGSAGNSTLEMIDALNTLSNRRNDLRYRSSKIIAALHPRNKSKNDFIDKSLHVSFVDAIKSSPKYGDILTIYNLKKQQNPKLKIIAKFMNNSYGIVMKNPRRRRRNRTEIRLRWIINQEIKASIKLKYLTKELPNIYFHPTSDECSNDWRCVSNLCRILLRNDRNIIINQLPNVSMMSHPFIVSESLVDRWMAKFETMYLMDFNQVSQMISFLCQMPYFLSPAVFQGVLDKLYASKVVRIKSVRTKLLPLLKAVYAEISIIYDDAFYTSVSDNDQSIYPLVAMDVLRNQSKIIVLREMKQYLFVEQAKYHTFFVMLKKCALQMLHRELCSRLTKDELMKHGEDGIVNTYDVVNTYRRALTTKQDVHLLFPMSEECNYEIMIRDIAKVLSCSDRIRIDDDSLMALIAKVTIKTVD